MAERFSRNEALFGAEGQRRIAATPVVIVGLGGLGSHVAQQLAYLGVRDFTLVDDDAVTDSSLNRVVTAVDADVDATTLKVDAAERLIRAIVPGAEVDKRDMRLVSAADAVRPGVVLFGCLDHDVDRLDLLGLTVEAGVPYFDLASDTGGGGEERWYGGRSLLSDGYGCLVCLDVLDREDVGRAGLGDAQREARDRSYGVDAEALDGTGPAVVSINGAVASLGVTEFMCLVTGLRAPQRQLTYRADQGIV
jgi:molybdopterin-synthase adenylyltransferase